MTNGRGAGMASFMTKKKKYKFQVEICLEELLEVPFVSAVLFAKLRLLDGGNFQDHSSRQEVQDHKVHWGANFTFPCKMMANASTGIMERCILRISIRKEYKGGRSFTKLGFVDLNLAEYAGAGLIHKKALLEGYDARHRQDNSMLKFKIELNMISGDILFKAPSPSLKHKQVNVEETNAEQRPDEFSSGSLAGSIASGSSGFGSLPKKRPALLSSELVIGQTLTENNAPVSVSTDHVNDNHPISSILSHSDQEPQETAALCEHGHSRNSSNTSQLSKASGYSSIQSHSHSRQSSSGDSGHIRGMQHRKLLDGVLSAGKLTPLANSPDDQNSNVIIVSATSDVSTDSQNLNSTRRPSVTTNPSAGSLVISETGSLDRAKAAYERRKKNQCQDTDAVGIPGRVEKTRVNVEDLVEDLLKNTNLEQPDDSAETSGLQLFIAKDGTAALGNHEVKSQMSAGVQVFKQVVMDNR
ncbi:early estrogen-induced gene 1 protein isoform X2 [Diorhabda sublineata]|uniref:early estrogen-induced gene 1 protein isoform X2 n=1 Tax=Diorhabda sublineata TaxID=1163346 RepID=UPI0024E08FFF|nr:early estrogen-induced gene 1 protein isoform X2 [Diorhabda sublineata]